MTPAVHRLSEGGESRVVNNWDAGHQKASFHASQLQIIDWMAEGLGKKGWRNLACRESLPHKEEALIKPSWGREFL